MCTTAVTLSFHKHWCVCVYARHRCNNMPTYVSRHSLDHRVMQLNTPYMLRDIHPVPYCTAEACVLPFARARNAPDITELSRC